MKTFIRMSLIAGFSVGLGMTAAFADGMLSFVTGQVRLPCAWALTPQARAAQITSSPTGEILSVFSMKLAQNRNRNMIAEV